MHDGCSASFTSGKQVVDKVRMMGFSDGALPLALPVECECGTKFEMEFFEDKCPSCGMVFAVTPCHSHDPASVKPAGIDY
jgi:hypothetical protein